MLFFRPRKDKWVVEKLVVAPILYITGHAISTIWMAYQPNEFAQVVKHLMEVNQWPIREEQKFYAAGARIVSSLDIYAHYLI